MSRSLFSCRLEKDVKGENQLEKRVNGEINFPLSHAPHHHARTTRYMLRNACVVSRGACGMVGCRNN
jgi:hypothetical protein